MKKIIIEESPLSKFLFSDTRSSILWFFIRIYVGFMDLVRCKIQLGLVKMLGERLPVL